LAKRAGVAAVVHAVDGVETAIAALTRAAQRAGLGRVGAEVRDLARRPLLADELRRYDAVVFDPPRAGAKEQAAELARSPVRIVVAVSCNPATFARDARLLVDGGYGLEWVRPVDQFLWSPHVELVARFAR
ncbi:MAG: RNA methyltransferase, partial [Candidatus Eiseniibacteriota bacterium]